MRIPGTPTDNDAFQFCRSVLNIEASLVAFLTSPKYYAVTRFSIAIHALLKKCSGDAERWPSYEEHLFLLQRTRIGIPVLTRQLTALSNSSFWAPNAAFCPPTLLATGVHLVNTHADV